MRFDLNLDGMLKVTAIERATGLETQLTVANALNRSDNAEGRNASDNLASVFGESPSEKWTQVDDHGDPVPVLTDPLVQQADHLVATARRLTAQAGPEDAEEIRELIHRIQTEKSTGNLTALHEFSEQLSDLLFYLEDV